MLSESHPVRVIFCGRRLRPNHGKTSVCVVIDLDLKYVCCGEPTGLTPLS